MGEVVVALGDELAQPKRVFGLEGEAPACLVELVEGDCLLCHLKGAACVAAVEERVSGALKQAEEGGGETAYVSVGPVVVGAFEGFAAPKREGRFERLRLPGEREGSDTRRPSAAEPNDSPA